MKITDDIWTAAVDEYHARERYPTFSGWKNMREALQQALAALEALHHTLTPWPAQFAEAAFLRVFERLTLPAGLTTNII